MRVDLSCLGTRDILERVTVILEFEYDLHLIFGIDLRSLNVVYYLELGWPFIFLMNWKLRLCDDDLRRIVKAFSDLEKVDLSCPRFKFAVSAFREFGVYEIMLITMKGVRFMLHNSRNVRMSLVSGLHGNESLFVDGVRSGRCLSELSFKDSNFSDEFLDGIVQARVPLKSMSFVDCNKYSIGGLLNVVTSYRLIKFLDLSRNYSLSDDSVIVLSKCLRDLVTVRFNFSLCVNGLDVYNSKELGYGLGYLKLFMVRRRWKKGRRIQGLVTSSFTKHLQRWKTLKIKASGKFSTTQSTIDAEINACINTLEKLKIYYLDKQEVTLRTDCQAIISFYNKTNSNKSSRVRWIKFADAVTGTGVKINIEHIEGKHNTLADSLSRLVNLCFAGCTGEMKELTAAALYSVEEALKSPNTSQKNMKITCEEVMKISNHFLESSQKLSSHLKNQEQCINLTSSRPTKPQSEWINLMHGDQSLKTLKFQQQKKQSKPCDTYKQSYNTKLKSVLGNQPKTTTGPIKRKMLEFKIKKPEESSSNWKPWHKDWDAITSNYSNDDDNTINDDDDAINDDNKYRYNRKGFLEDDERNDDSIFIVDPGWDDYSLQAIKSNRPVPLCPEARRARM
ncbi:putative polyprotein [Tanacetum coccineum]